MSTALIGAVAAGLLLTLVPVQGQVVSLDTTYYPSHGKVKLDIGTPLRKPVGPYRAPKAPSWNVLFLGENLFTSPEGKTGLRADYYDNREMNGEPVVSRVEPFAGPDREFARGKFEGKNNAVSWHGTYGPAPQTGVYLLHTESAGGSARGLKGKA